MQNSVYVGVENRQSKMDRMKEWENLHEKVLMEKRVAVMSVEEKAVHFENEKMKEIEETKKEKWRNTDIDTRMSEYKRYKSLNPSMESSQNNGLRQVNRFTITVDELDWLAKHDAKTKETEQIKKPSISVSNEKQLDSGKDYSNEGWRYWNLNRDRVMNERLERGEPVNQPGDGKDETTPEMVDFLKKHDEKMRKQEEYFASIGRKPLSQILKEQDKRERESLQSRSQNKSNYKEFKPQVQVIDNHHSKERSKLREAGAWGKAVSSVVVADVSKGISSNAALNNARDAVRNQRNKLFDKASSKVKVVDNFFEDKKQKISEKTSLMKVGMMKFTNASAQEKVNMSEKPLVSVASKAVTLTAANVVESFSKRFKKHVNEPLKERTERISQSLGSFKERVKERKQELDKDRGVSL